jgi:hypothetical protein
LSRCLRVIDRVSGDFKEADTGHLGLYLFEALITATFFEHQAKDIIVYTKAATDALSPIDCLWMAIRISASCGF